MWIRDRDFDIEEGSRGCIAENGVGRLFDGGIALTGIMEGLGPSVDKGRI